MSDSVSHAPSRRTIHEVALKAKVSITTVSRTINSPSLVDPDTAQRVLAAIDELKYYPNSQARSLVSGRSRMLGMIVSDITNPFFPELVKGFEDVAVRQGYDVMIGSTDYDPPRMSLCVRRMLERKVDGVAVMTSEMDEHLVEQMTRRNVPLVFLDVVTPRQGISNILVDYERGVDQAVDHLVSLGHRRIGFVAGPPNLKSAQMRRSAFLRSLSRYGIHEDHHLIVDGDHKVMGGLTAMTRLLEGSPRPTAVLASNDLTAVGMMRAIRRAGLSVPGDISVVGFDDIWLAEFTEPPLTTVRLSRQDLADQAFRALVTDRDEPASNEYRVSTMLVIRETTGAVGEPTRVAGYK